MSNDIKSPADEDDISLNPTLRVQITAIWNQRNVGARTLTIDTRRSPDSIALARFLVDAALNECESMELDPSLRHRLDELGIIGGEDNQPTETSLSYDWPLRREILLPCPNRLNFDSGISLEDLVVNEDCFVRDGAQLGHELEASFVLPSDEVIAVPDPGTGITALYRSPTSQGSPSFFRRLLEYRGQPLRNAFKAGVITQDEVSRWDGAWQLLRRAQVLVPSKFHLTRSAEWMQRCDEYRDAVKEHGFAILRGILNPAQIALVREYYRAAVAFGLFDYNDGQVERRSGWHNEPAAHYFHRQLVRLVNRIVPNEVKASYAYLGVYHEGAVLDRHIDRPQCSWNLSIPLDANPETDATNAWPIYLDVDGQPREVRLGLGDGVLYRGTEVYHWRNPQPAGHTTTICFFHFVDAAFAGPLD